MMAPDYTHSHGMFEVAERFYMELVPQAQELVTHATGAENGLAAQRAERVIEDVLHRPEHAWFVEGAEGEAARIRAEMERRYGADGR